ncbi:organelle RRM domain-containing protein 6, chloroplastic-like [Vicia villosa]|uniref:organelle RRM domain-containing protein 6, chloroplastic-like n=1 Tax=Vicia villosa TaxID=3911 RepID=UPI00273ABED9|nr:organelle RRM domain-containing protein 6, chloroplastic-like [Vicia villosa]
MVNPATATMANIIVGVPSLSLPSLHSTNSNTFTLNSKIKTQNHKLHLNFSQTNHTTNPFPSSKSLRNRSSRSVLACLPPASESSSSNNTPSSTSSSTKLYVSGLSFGTTEESLRNAFKNFGQLVEVNLVMDKIANRPRGFAFLRYETEEESNKAIEGMHGKFLDGRVIFVEIAKPKSELRQRFKQNTM